MIYNLDTLIDFLYGNAPLICMILLVGVYIDDKLHDSTPEGQADLARTNARIQEVVNKIRREQEDENLSIRSEQIHGVGRVSKWRHNNWYTAF